MESLPLFSLGLAYVFSISPFSSLNKISIPLGSQKTQHKSPKRTGRQRSHSRIFFFSWDRWDGWDGCDGWDGWMDGLMDGWMDGWMDGSSLWGIGFPYILRKFFFFFRAPFCQFSLFFFDSILLILLGTHLNNYLQNGLVRTLASRLPLG